MRKALADFALGMLGAILLISVFLASFGCGPLSAGIEAFESKWAEDPPPHTPGVPFYVDPAFWYWALGTGVPGAAAAVHGVVGLPGTKRRAVKKAASVRSKTDHAKLSALAAHLPTPPPPPAAPPAVLPGAP